jgi:hypothetical protein
LVAIGPRGVDTHGAAQKAAVAGLELFINFVLHDHGFWIGGLVACQSASARSSLGAMWRGTYSPAPIAVGGRASPYRRSGSAKLFWEDDLQCLEDQLHPGVFLDRQQGDDFGACGYHDGDSGNSGGIHNE